MFYVKRDGSGKGESWLLDAGEFCVNARTFRSVVGFGLSAIPALRKEFRRSEAATGNDTVKCPAPAPFCGVDRHCFLKASSSSSAHRDMRGPKR